MVTSSLNNGAFLPLPAQRHSAGGNWLLEI
jgi:hypothetical protein